jgi:ribonuclease HI
MLQINDKVVRIDGDRAGWKGTVIELDGVKKRARIKWDKESPRTWMKFSSLFKITAEEIKCLDAPKTDFVVFTDGAVTAHKDSTPLKFFGGYGTIIFSPDGKWLEGFGASSPDTTISILELIAPLETLEYLFECQKENIVSPTSVKIYTDSQYVASGVNKYLPIWSVNGWKLYNGKPVANQDIWKRYLDILAKFQSMQCPVTFEKVPGHSTIKGWKKEANDIADLIAVHAKFEKFDTAKRIDLNKFNLTAKKVIDWDVSNAS